MKPGITLNHGGRTSRRWSVLGLLLLLAGWQASAMYMGPMLMATRLIGTDALVINGDTARSGGRAGHAVVWLGLAYGDFYDRIDDGPWDVCEHRQRHAAG